LDKEFADTVQKLNNDKTVVFSIGHNTVFSYNGNDIKVKYTVEDGRTIEHTLLTITELVEGDKPFSSSDEDWMDSYLPLLTAIESAIDGIYRLNMQLKDKTVLAIIQRLIMKPDINLNDELTRCIQANVRLILSTIRYSKVEVIGCLKKVERSIKRHHSVEGSRGYLDFIKGRV
jgi:hypothetical protein